MRAQSSRCKLLDRHRTKRLQQHAPDQCPALRRSVQSTAHGNSARGQQDAWPGCCNGIPVQADRSLVSLHSPTLGLPKVQALQRVPVPARRTSQARREQQKVATYTTVASVPMLQKMSAPSKPAWSNSALIGSTLLFIAIKTLIGAADSASFASGLIDARLVGLICNQACMEAVNVAVLRTHTAAQKL